MARNASSAPAGCRQFQAVDDYVNRVCHKLSAVVAYRREETDLSHAYSPGELLIEKLEMEGTSHPLRNAIINTPEFDRIHKLVK